MKQLLLSADEKASLVIVVTSYNRWILPATRLLSSSQRQAILVLSAWVYQAIEISQIQDGDPLRTLQAYEEELLKVWDGKETRHLITLLFVRLAKEYEFPKKDCIVFLTALERSIAPNPFSTRQELETWLTHSGGIVGCLAATVLELPPSGAQTLSQAFRWIQMVYLLASVGRNWRLFNRILLPISLLQQYGLERDQLWNRRHTWQWHEFIHDETTRLLEQKREIEKDLHTLPRTTQALLNILIELETWTLERLRKQPILCWSIRSVQPSTARSLQVITWWTWKMKGLPRAKKSWKLGKTLAGKGFSLLRKKAK